MRSVAYHQTETYEAAKILARTEGLIAAPETAHAVKCAMDEALTCKKTGEAKVIALNYSGHGLLDLSGYRMYLDGKLKEYEPLKVEVPKYVT
jgi:tryptophan synthase beta chain